MAIRIPVVEATPIFDSLNEEVEELGHVWEACEHGLSRDLCEGPMHYPPDYDCPF